MMVNEEIDELEMFRDLFEMIQRNSYQGKPSYNKSTIWLGRLKKAIEARKKPEGRIVYLKGTGHINKGGLAKAMREQQLKDLEKTQDTVDVPILAVDQAEAAAGKEWPREQKEAVLSKAVKVTELMSEDAEPIRMEPLNIPKGAMFTEHPNDDAVDSMESAMNAMALKPMARTDPNEMKIQDLNNPSELFKKNCELIENKEELIRQLTVANEAITVQSNKINKMRDKINNQRKQLSNDTIKTVDHLLCVKNHIGDLVQDNITLGATLEKTQRKKNKAGVLIRNLKRENEQLAEMLSDVTMKYMGAATERDGAVYELKSIKAAIKQAQQDSMDALRGLRRED